MDYEKTEKDVFLGVRVPKDLRERARKLAEEKGTTLSEVIRAHLQAFVSPGYIKVIDDGVTSANPQGSKQPQLSEAVSKPPMRPGASDNLIKSRGEKINSQPEPDADPDDAYWD